MRAFETEIKVGIFMTIGVVLLMIAILGLGSTENLFSSNRKYKVHFATVEGLITGAKVVLGGINVGTVESIDIDPARRNIAITLSVAQKYENWIRMDTEAEIATQGVLGDKYIVLTMGSLDKEAVPKDGEITQRPGKDFSQFLTKGDALMASLNSIAKSMDAILKNFEKGNRSDLFFEGMSQSAKNLSLATERINQELLGGHLRGSLKNLHSILEKINNGAGTLGSLINDPALYDDAKSLMGGANRSRIMRNLVRTTIKENEEKAAEAEKKTPAP